MKKLKLSLLFATLCIMTSLLLACGAKEEKSKEDETSIESSENNSTEDKSTEEALTGNEATTEEQTTEEQTTQEQTTEKESESETETKKEEESESATTNSDSNSGGNSNSGGTGGTGNSGGSGSSTAPEPEPEPEPEPPTQPAPEANYGAIVNKGTYDIDKYSKRDYQYEQAKVKAESVINSILKTSMTYPERVKAIHDWLVVNVNYDYDVLNNLDNYDGDEPQFSAYGALVNNWAVCEGYSEGFLLLCWTAGIEARLVEGTATNTNGTVGHEWNVVKLEGNWYQIDVTWDDPAVNGVPNDPTGENLRYKYCLITTADMKKDHVIEGWYSADGSLGEVSCTSTAYYNLVDTWAIKNKIGDLPYTIVSSYDEANAAALKYIKQGLMSFAILYSENSLDYKTVRTNVQSTYGTYLQTATHPANWKGYSYKVGTHSESDRGYSIDTLTLTLTYEYWN